MNVVTFFAGGLLLCAGVVGACSSTSPGRPAIETTGSKNPSPGGGSSSSGGTSSSGVDGGGTMGAGVPDGGICNPSTCPTGCCTTGNDCESQQLNSACGIGGGVCQTCSVGLTCEMGTCQ
jgi:hypothetical protein